MNDEMLMELYETERKQNARYIMAEVRVEEDRAEAFTAAIADIKAENFECKIVRREVVNTTTWCVIEVSGEIGPAYRQYLEHIGFEAELERLKNEA